MTTRLSTILVAVGVSTVACGGGAPAVGADPQPRGSDTLFVSVISQNFYDASIFLVYVGSTRRRLGTVRGYSSREFPVRWEPSDVRLEVDFVGARFQTRTAEFRTRPGETLELQLPASSHRTGQLIARRR